MVSVGPEMDGKPFRHGATGNGMNETPDFSKARRLPSS
jgi:hypothetical protein